MKYNNNFNKQKLPESLPSKQDGIALLSVVLVLLVVIGLLSMTSSKNTILETKTVFNLQDKQRSIMAADSAAQYGWLEIKDSTDIKQIINNTSAAGYYVLGDDVPTTAKKASDWNSHTSVTTWPWDDSNRRFEIPDQLGGSVNPMKLISKPQYIVGMHDSVIRKGTSNFRCLPVSIIGASQGGTSQTRTLIELKAIPKSTCYKEIVK